MRETLRETKIRNYSVDRFITINILVQLIKPRIRLPNFCADPRLHEQFALNFKNIIFLKNNEK